MRTTTAPPAGEILSPGEVAKWLRVDPKTVTRWANEGIISSFRTLGGVRRYRRAEIQAHLDATRQERTA